MQLLSDLQRGAVPGLISCFSVAYLAVFLPLCLVFYQIVSQRARRVVLLVASYLFSFLISGKLAVFLFLSTLSVHYFGIWLDRLQKDEAALLGMSTREEKKSIRAACKKRQLGILLFAVSLHLCVLLTLKYTPFFAQNINHLLKACGASFLLKIPVFFLPVGISFYTLQAIAYLTDVYQRKITADGNLLRLALFLSFFPQIAEGPICRYSQTAQQLYAAKRIRYEAFLLGSWRILFGLFKKLLVADRLNLFVKTVFDAKEKNDGAVIAFAALCFTVQLYMDFSGSMDAALGTAQILGIALPENFARPFFSRSVSEFWQRWHITLGTFFKDYVFFPLSMTKPLKKLTAKARRHIGNHFGPLLGGAVALFCVWLCNGLWHGAGWFYIAFGMYHFCLILCGNLTMPLSRFLLKKLHINAGGLPWQLFQTARTFVLVVIGELIFRSNGLSIAAGMLRRIFTSFHPQTLFDGTLVQNGLDRMDLAAVAAALCIVFAVSFCNEKGHSVRAWLMRRPLPVRFAVLHAAILAIIVFGAYGIGYVPVDPMYANF